MRPAAYRTVLRSVLVVAAATGLGCEGTNREVVPAGGTITFSDGKPLPAGTRVIFNPSEGKTGTASGTTDETGAFTLTHVNGTTGAEIGKYSVQLLAPEGGAGSFFKTVPKDYADGSVLSAEVAPDMEPIRLTVRRPKK